MLLISLAFGVLHESTLQKGLAWHDILESGKGVKTPFQAEKRRIRDPD
jgi:hypothetical protein